MRYFHDNVDRITDFIEGRNLHLFLLDVKGQQVPRAVNVTVLKEYLSYTRHLWGSFPKTYFIATHESWCSPIPVHEAVAQAEAEASVVVFALVGYGDGGVFSISKRELPFQAGTQQQPNWEPIAFSKPTKLAVWLDRLAALFRADRRFDH